MRVGDVIAVLCLFVACANSIKILCIFPTTGHSHYTVGHELMRRLAERGHEVTFVSPFQPKEPTQNLTEIVLTGFVEKWEEKIKEMNPLSFHNMPAILSPFFFAQMTTEFLESTLEHENMQKLIHSDETFDILLVEHFNFDGFLALGPHFGVPTGMISAVGPSVSSNYLVGAPNIPSYMGPLVLEPPYHTTFWKRAYSFIIYILDEIIRYVYVFPAQDKILRKYIPTSPNIYDVVYNTSLVIYNSDCGFNQPMPTAPNVVEIGGFHVRPPKKLPDDLQKVLDNAPNGVVYFSMGSVLKSKLFPVDQRREILTVLSKLKETVLWKFEEDLADLPPNIIIRSWFPQSDLLAHRNVKLFITHGGVLSTIEALHRGVPVVGIPVFGDQRLNMVNAVNRGQGVMIPYGELTGEKLSNALDEVLNNPKYLENVKYSSSVLKDRLVDPIDEVEYWLEYVVRHRGAKHLRLASMELTWYQHASIDVILFLTAVNSMLLYIFYKIIRRWLGRKQTNKQKTN